MLHKMEYLKHMVRDQNDLKLRDTSDGVINEMARMPNARQAHRRRSSGTVQVGQVQ